MSHVWYDEAGNLLEGNQQKNKVHLLLSRVMNVEGLQRP